MILLAAMSTDDCWCLAVAVTGSVAASLLGGYLILRRLSLLGDALSHGVLPGIALGYLLTGSLTGWGIMFGALLFGFLTAFLAQTINARVNVPEDSSIGIVFTALFSIGVILVSRVLTQVHIDSDCIFFGNLEQIVLDMEYWFGIEVPHVLPTMAMSLLLTVGFIALFWKELKIASFDPALSQAMGYRPQLVHYLLMGLVSLVSVTSFEAVGSIVVVAMLIVPAACAYLLTDRLAVMLMLAAAVGALSAVLGYFVRPPEGNVPGMMAVMAGALLLLAVLFAPRHGVLAKVIRNVRLSLRIAMEDILADLYRREESERSSTRAPISGASRWITRLAYARLRRLGRISPALADDWQLTDQGRHQARSLIRAHRLWEAFLEKNLDLPPDHLHDAAMRMEHFIGPALQEELSADLDTPHIDPHGREIPDG